MDSASDRRVGRYTLGARMYDVVSGERLVYREPRVAAIGRLGLRAGERVLDLGCGTGLNLPLLLDEVGPSGHVTGLDASSSMLAQASARVEREGWDNAELVRADAADLARAVGEQTFDAVVATYTLSIMDGWTGVWAQALTLLRPGGRVAVVDLSMPSGIGLPLWPLARFACWTGGADPHREPWRAAQRDLDEVRTTEHRAGHVVAVTGVRR